jgi:hypothetical protein
MYKTPNYDHEQLSFIGFNSTCGLQLDPQNEWIVIAGKLPWRAWETLYAAMFPAETGNVLYYGQDDYDRMKPYKLLFSLVLAGWFDLLVLRPPFPIPGNTRQYQAIPGNAY